MTVYLCDHPCTIYICVPFHCGVPMTVTGCRAQSKDEKSKFSERFGLHFRYNKNPEFQRFYFQIIFQLLWLSD